MKNEIKKTLGCITFLSIHFLIRVSACQPAWLTPKLTTNMPTNLPDCPFFCYYSFCYYYIKENVKECWKKSFILLLFLCLFLHAFLWLMFFILYLKHHSGAIYYDFLMCWIYVPCRPNISKDLFIFFYFLKYLYLQNLKNTRKWAKVIKFYYINYLMDDDF